MAEEKQSPIGIIVVVAVIAVVAGIFLFKGGSNNGDQNAGNQQQPTNGSDTNKATPPPSPKKKANGSDTNKTAPQPEPPKPEKPAEPKEPAFVKEGLVAYYPFNGNAKDESGNGNDLTSKGATLTKDRHGNADSAYAFDGSAYMEAPNDASLQLTELAVSMWINPIVAEKISALLFKDNHPGNNYGVWLYHGGNEIKFGIYPGTRRDGGFGLHAKKLRLVPMNADSMITATLGNNTAHLYINGSLVASSETTQVPGKDTQPLFLGYWGGVDARLNKFKGTMDDIRIYNRALSEAEVKELYELEKPKE
jgi:hypothetical protein